MPTFVLKLSLARHCASDFPDEIQAGMEAVLATLQDNYVRPNEANAAQSKVAVNGKYEFERRIFAATKIKCLSDKRKMTMAKIVCVGLACLDYLFKVESLPRGGGKTFASQFVSAPGGPAAAASLAVAALGHEAIFLGRLGNDAIGDEIIRSLEKRGVNAGRIHRVPGQNSQVSSVVVDERGERQIVNFSSAQLDPDPHWLPADVIAAADFLLTDVRWPEGAQRALEIARNHQVPSLIDADIAPVDIGHLVKLASHAVFSERGLEMVTGLTDPKSALKKAAQTSHACVAVTVGENGCFWLENGTIDHCPAEPIDAIDTCSAGDVFHGAFAVAMVENMGLADAMRFAGIAAALKCRTFGGSLGVPHRSAVDARLADSLEF